MACLILLTAQATGGLPSLQVTIATGSLLIQPDAEARLPCALIPLSHSTSDSTLPCALIPLSRSTIDSTLPCALIPLSRSTIDSTQEYLLRQGGNREADQCGGQHGEQL